MKHILSARQFNQAELDDIFKRTDDMREAMASRDGRRELAARHSGGIVATLFYEPSTRTRLSFESAAQRLGMGVISTENAAEFSSASKGETIEDTTRVVARYADVLVMRHKEKGAAECAAAVSDIPVINAGDGTGEHPTQALLDAYTIQHEKGELSGLRVVIGGDLKHGRTARSLAQLLSIFPGNQLSFVSTPELAMGDDVLNHLRIQGTAYQETDDLMDVVHSADVVYWTRLQTERLADPGQRAGFTIGQAALQAMQPDAIIMHPLPRVGEIETSVDADPRAKYFDQAGNGLYVRMGLIDQLAGELT